MPRFSRPNAQLTGILLYSLGIFMFALSDAIGKWLAGHYSVGQLLLFRSCGALIPLPLLWRTKVRFPLTGSAPLHLLRVVCMAVDTYAFYFATRTLPLADVMAFYMAAPLIITALAVCFAGERIGWLGWAAVVVGFLGVLIALRPTGDVLAPGAVIALAGSLMFALAVTITRALRQSNPLGLIAYQFLGAGLIGGLASPIGWSTPGVADLALMFLMGMIAIACFFCLNKALAAAPASVLAPFNYPAIIWAATIGWIVWGDWPAPNVIAGSVLIIASGLAVIATSNRAPANA